MDLYRRQSSSAPLQKDQLSAASTKVAAVRGLVTLSANQTPPPKTLDPGAMMERCRGGEQCPSIPRQRRLRQPGLALRVRGSCLVLPRMLPTPTQRPAIPLQPSWHFCKATNILFFSLYGMSFPLLKRSISTMQVQSLKIKEKWKVFEEKQLSPACSLWPSLLSYTPWRHCFQPLVYFLWSLSPDPSVITWWSWIYQCWPPSVDFFFC